MPLPVIPSAATCPPQEEESVETRQAIHTRRRSTMPLALGEGSQGKGACTCHFLRPEGCWATSVLAHNIPT